MNNSIFRHVINESSGSQYETHIKTYDRFNYSPEDIYSILTTMCPSLMKYYTDLYQNSESTFFRNSKFLYRGGKQYSNERDSFLETFQSPESRISMSMSPYMNDIIDGVLKQYGAIALRSNSSFTTNVSTIARSYSPIVRSIFPIEGKSSLTYLQTEDIFISLSNLLANYGSRYFVPSNLDWILFPNYYQLLVDLRKDGDASLDSIVGSVGFNMDGIVSKVSIDDTFRSLFRVMKDKNFRSKEFLDKYFFIETESDLRKYVSKINLLGFEVLYGKPKLMDAVDVSTFLKNIGLNDSYEIYVHGQYFVLDVDTFVRDILPQSKEGNDEE